MKKLTMKIMLIAIGAAFSINAFAAVDAAALERQRKANQAGLSKSKTLKRHFDKTGSADGPAIKLDAIPPSPRRGAKTTSTPSSEQAITASPRHSASTNKE